MLPKSSGAIYPQLAIGDPGFDGFGRISFHDGGIFSGISFNEGGGAILGTLNLQNRGARLADVGDVNRDGYADLVASCTTLDNGAVFQAGRVDFHAGSISGLQPATTVLAGDRDFDRVGSAIAGRGDVNGDGYFDVVIGAREWDSASLADCGKAWVFLGSPTGPAASPWMREGSAAGQGMGASVAMTDLDGDGYSDVVVGSSAPAGVSLPQPGRVEVFYGGPGGLATTPGLVLDGRVPEVSFGAVVAAIGDVTGDGIADLGVGAPLQDGLGMVFIYPGTLGRSQGRIPIRFYTGTQAGGRFGAAIAGGGDIDGDGIGDFAIGSPGYDSGVVDDGRVDLYPGAPEAPPATPTYSFTPGITGAKCGETMAPFLDANLDGFADMVVGAPGAAGRVYPFLGGGGAGHMAAVTLYEPNIAFKRRLHPARLDATAAVNTEMFYASPAGRARIGIEFEAVTQNTPFTGVPTQATGLIYDSDAPDDGAGLLSSVIRVFPNVNLPWPGRGYHVRARFVTRSPFFPRSRWITPEAHTSGDLDVWTAGAVVDAGPPAVTGLGLRAIAPNPALVGETSRVSFAPAQAAACAWTCTTCAARTCADCSTRSGRPRPRRSRGMEGRGGAGGPGGRLFRRTALGGSLRPGEGGAAGALVESGARRCSPGGWGRLCVGWSRRRVVPLPIDRRRPRSRPCPALPVSPGCSWFLPFSSSPSAFPPGPASPSRRSPRCRGRRRSPHRTTTSDVSSPRRGTSTATATAMCWSPRRSTTSRPTGTRGGSTCSMAPRAGIAPPPPWSWSAGKTNVGTGMGLAAAGDVNGDGYADIAVGVSGWSIKGAFGCGKVAIFHGSASGLPAVPSLELFPPDAAQFDHFGTAVATAGDVNADGYADLIVGAPDANRNAIGQCGVAFVFHGGASGVAQVPSFTYAGPDPNGRAGAAVSTAGDVNGDGYADVLVGAPQGRLGGVASGEVKVFLGTSLRDPRSRRGHAQCADSDREVRHLGRERGRRRRRRLRRHPHRRSRVQQRVLQRWTRRVVEGRPRRARLHAAPHRRVDRLERAPGPGGRHARRPRRRRLR